MSVSIFNFTGRKDVLRTGGVNPEIEIKIWDTDKGVKFEPTINLDKDRGFPSDAKIKIQVYSTSGDNFVSPPFDFGTVNKPESEPKEIETSKETIKFSFRIVDIEKNILCLIEPIKPKKGNTLLRYAEQDQDSFFEVEIEPDEIPIVWFKKGHGLKSLLLESNFFKAFIFTAAIRQVLQKYILMESLFEDCKYKKGWIKNFEKLIGKDVPTKENFFEGDASLTDGEKWINEAVDRFTEKPNSKGVRLKDLVPNEDIEINKKLQWKK